MASPRLVVCCGLPGVGKSTVSAYIADHLDAVRYRSDEIRKELFGAPEYTPAESRATYDEMFDRARETLDGGRHAVVDATFADADRRDRAARVGTEAGAAVQFVRVTCPPDTVRERIRSRSGDASDADVAVYEQIRDAFDPFDREHVAVDNGGSLAETHRQVDRQVLDGGERD